MSTTTTCPAVAVGTTGWTLTGAGSFNAALSDGSDASYASAPSSGTITPAFGTNFDVSAIPGSAIITSMVLVPRVGVGALNPGDQGALIWSLSDPGGLIHSGSLSLAYPNGGISTQSSSSLFVRSNGAHLDRAILNSLAFSAQGQASGGSVTLYIVNLALNVTWSAQSGGVL